MGGKVKNTNKVPLAFYLISYALIIGGITLFGIGIYQIAFTTNGGQTLIMLGISIMTNGAYFSQGKIPNSKD